MRDIDELGRLAGVQVRSADHGDEDVDARLDDLVHKVQRRRRIKLIGAAAGSALLVGGLSWGVSSLGFSSSATPTSHGHANPSVGLQVPGPGDTCAIDLVRCSGPSRAIMTFTMATPMTWHRPNTFEYIMNVASNRSGSMATSIYANRTKANAGVFASMPVRAVATSSIGGHSGDLATARGLTEWIAARPFVEASSVTRVTLDGLPAWSVQISLKPRAGCTDHTGDHCRPLLWAPGDNNDPAQFIFNGMVARFTLVEVPGAGTASICSWTLDRPSSLNGNQPLIRSIHFVHD